MIVWVQSSQRATWPPSAAVRQHAMADITFSWSRLDVPGIGSAPSEAVVAKNIRDLQRWTGHGRRPLRRRLDFPAPAWLLARLR